MFDVCVVNLNEGKSYKQPCRYRSINDYGVFCRGNKIGSNRSMRYLVEIGSCG